MVKKKLRQHGKGKDISEGDAPPTACVHPVKSAAVSEHANQGGKNRQEFSVCYRGVWNRWGKPPGQAMVLGAWAENCRGGG